VLPFLERAGLVTAPVSDDTRAYVARIVEILGDRIRVFGDILLQAPFFFGDEVAFDDKAFAKRVLAPGAADRLADYRGWLADQAAFDAPALEKGTQDLMAAKGLGLGDIVHAVRIAVTGVPVGPGLFDALSVLGKDACLRRIDRALAKARAA
jgi:glutamyl-tRNA synthetase